MLIPEELIARDDCSPSTSARLNARNTQVRHRLCRASTFGPYSTKSTPNPLFKSKSESELSGKPARDRTGMHSFPFNVLAYLLCRSSGTERCNDNRTSPCKKVQDSLFESDSNKGFQVAEIKQRWRNQQIRLQQRNQKSSFWIGLPILRHS